MQVKISDLGGEVLDSIENFLLEVNDNIHSGREPKDFNQDEITKELSSFQIFKDQKFDAIINCAEIPVFTGKSSVNIELDYDAIIMDESEAVISTSRSSTLYLLHSAKLWVDVFMGAHVVVVNLSPHTEVNYRLYGKNSSLSIIEHYPDCFLKTSS